MKNRTHIRAASPLSFLLLVAIFAALASLSFYPHSATYAQTETSETLEVPELTARATGTNTVEFSWTAVTGAVRYELLAWQDSVTGWQRLDDGSLTGASYTHGGLTAGTTYYYTIRALNAAGETSGWLLDYPYATALAAQGDATSTPTSTATPAQTPTSGPTPTPTSATTERGALIALYQATGGANWTRSDNWLTDKPLSAWYGVTTDAGGRVTELRLPNIGLSGPLPDLSALTNLTRLYLGSNQLSGTIPPELSNLANLEVLMLAGNQLSGCAPAIWQDVLYNDLDQLGLPFCST